MIIRRRRASSDSLGKPQLVDAIPSLSHPLRTPADLDPLMGCEVPETYPSGV